MGKYDRKSFAKNFSRKYPRLARVADALATVLRWFAGIVVVVLVVWCVYAAVQRCPVGTTYTCW